VQQSYFYICDYDTYRIHIKNLMTKNIIKTCCIFLSPDYSALLANGCDPAVRSPRGETALHRVILNGGPSNVLKFVEDLLKYDCPPGVKEAGSGSTALHVLSRQLAHTSLKSLRHFDAALKTLELLAKAGPVNAKDHQGRSALHILASSTIFGTTIMIVSVD